MKVVFVTSNKGKAIEVAQILAPLGLEVEARHADVPEIKSDSVRETACAKAVESAKMFGMPAIAEDTGLFFDAYPKFPGVNTKFAFNALGFEGLLKLLEGKPRGAKFITVVAYCVPSKETVAFEGECKGSISEKVFDGGHDSLPYDRVFAPEGDKRVFAQMSAEEKATYAHRAKALQAFAKWFKESIK